MSVGERLFTAEVGTKVAMQTMGKRKPKQPIEDPFENTMVVNFVHKYMPPWATKDSEYLLHIHMMRAFQHPVKGPVYPEPIGEMMSAFEHAGMLPNQRNMPHATAEANILLTPEQFVEWGRPYPGQKVKVRFEVKKN